MVTPFPPKPCHQPGGVNIHVNNPSGNFNKFHYIPWFSPPLYSTPAHRPGLPTLQMQHPTLSLLPALWNPSSSSSNSLTSKPFTHLLSSQVTTFPILYKPHDPLLEPPLQTKFYPLIPASILLAPLPCLSNTMWTKLPVPISATVHALMSTPGLWALLEKITQPCGLRLPDTRGLHPKLEIFH